MHGAGIDRKLDTRAPQCGLAPIDPPFLRNRLEQVDVRADALRRSKDQATAFVQGEMQELNQFVLHVRLEIDQQIAAAHQVELRKRGIAEYVLLGEQHRVAQRLAYLVTVVVQLVKKA
jgi:hypothetical protein